MTQLQKAKLHLQKARQFLDAAELTRDMELYDAATSAAVSSSINSKDAICLSSTGASARSDNHVAAVAELKAASALAAELASTFKRLLEVKAKAQYHESGITATRAQEAVKRAHRMYEAAVRIVTR